MKRICLITMILLLSGAWVGAADPDVPTAPAIDDPRFDFLKRLEGTWTAEGDQEGMPEGRFEFRVTSGGTAIEEREMIGTPMEMMTVYHMDGRDLVATHYCMLGNQPHVTAARKVVDDTLVFSCNGKPGNARSHDDEHIHGWSMRLDGDGKLYYEAQLVKEGKATEAPAFVLTRQSETASR